ncbi:hypothetical protein DICPUDRAFT_59190 [Dictyostelium purpureum]|uniref:Uncharacterized protein n=1 Tax=Dictyostelium purpureum TaxID=5786 RepID=F1A4T7_DICPU|nr:uncharacterized protein DICPUDRAFT_59190 [Dictyostelium purpureum]EGC28796.1 hypothetical protein DICPUDRAFT_59190 [Dictyostelium purpureum]|eukprot:XP_003294681.1 hypothetical protein DICPUDRAFT_59190 [Dictyostelium purpureum]
MVDLQKVLNAKFNKYEYHLTTKQVSLYALSIGCGRKDLKYVYEGSHDFSALPTIGVIFPGQIIVDIISEGIPGLEFDPMMLLHGEQYLEIKNPIPTQGIFETETKITGLYDKGKGALLLFDCLTSDKSNGKPIFLNRFSFYIRGIGGFGGPKQPVEKTEKIPQRKPDATFSQKTTEDQAAIYRLAGGDLNPLHIDPEMSKIGGFKVPILHGLCTFGIASRGVVEHFCGNDPSKLKNIRVRFSNIVYPGETIESEYWKVDDKVLFQSKTSRDGSLVLTNGIATIGSSTNSSL